jgi:hypothetical protein
LQASKLDSKQIKNPRISMRGQNFEQIISMAQLVSWPHPQDAVNFVSS